MTPLTNDVIDLMQLTKLLGLERQSFTIARIWQKKHLSGLDFGNKDFLHMASGPNHIYKSLVIRQKGKSQNGCYKKTKHAKFYVKRAFLPPDTHIK